MLKTYDSTQAAFTERDSVKYYDNTAAAWVEAQSAKTYDTAEAAWVERLVRKLTVMLSATDGATNYSSNIITYSQNLFYLDVKPASKTFYVRAKVSGDFTNPVISGLYTFGHSDKYTLGESSNYSHDAANWKINGYLNGSKTQTVQVANGASYRNATIFDAEFSAVLEGTFDEIELECQIASFSSTYQLYGVINTQIKEFAIDGVLCYGNQSI